MRDGAGVFILVGIILAVILIVWISGLKEKARKFAELEPQLRGIVDRERQLQGKITAFEAEKVLEVQRRERDRLEHQKRVEEDEHAIRRLGSEISIGFPWLATAISDYFAFRDGKVAWELEFKARPALKAAAEIREIAASRRDAERELRTWKYRAKYYEGLVPWLSDVFDADFGKILEASRRGDGVRLSDDEREDPALGWLSPDEYKHLPEAERNQRALDRYTKRKKSPWEIGRDYERFVGYRYEQAGCKVIYHGIIEGFDDLGRDIIATKGTMTYLVQCKYWSASKTIYEKHICQLVGTALEFALSRRQQRPGGAQLEMFAGLLAAREIKPVFCTSTELSDRAKHFARVLGIEVLEKLSLGEYPLVKCNIARRSGERIYHLPFDQQYDRTVIEPDRGELYARTVAEAEQQGFRRAWRWKPERDD